MTRPMLDQWPIHRNLHNYAGGCLANRYVSPSPQARSRLSSVGNNYIAVKNQNTAAGNLGQLSLTLPAPAHAFLLTSGMAHPVLTNTPGNCPGTQPPSRSNGNFWDPPGASAGRPVWTLASTQAPVSRIPRPAANVARLSFSSSAPLQTSASTCFSGRVCADRSRTSTSRLLPPRRLAHQHASASPPDARATVCGNPVRIAATASPIPATAPAQHHLQQPAGAAPTRSWSSGLKTANARPNDGQLRGIPMTLRRALHTYARPGPCGPISWLPAIGSHALVVNYATPAQLELGAEGL